MRKKSLPTYLLLVLLLISKSSFSQELLNEVYSKKSINTLETGNYSITGHIIIPVLEKLNGVYVPNKNIQFTDSDIKLELFRPFRGNVFNTKTDTTTKTENKHTGWKYNDDKNDKKKYIFDYVLVLEMPEDFFVYPFPGKVKSLKINEKRFASFLNLKDEHLNEFVFYNPAKDLFEYQQEKINSRLFWTNNFYIHSLKYYIDSVVSEKKTLTSVNNYTNQTVLFYVKDFTSFFEPFYFKKTEVTNSEYREFVDWVKDSTARRLLVKSGFNEYKAQDRKSRKNKDYSNLNKCRLNWDKKVDWNSSDENYRDALRELYISEKERFYRQKEIDSEKLLYEYTAEDGDVKRIKIYPDTTVWLGDYTYSYSEPLSKRYFWHSDYYEYPVVGVSYAQSMAFCDWKSKRLQEEFDNKKLKYKVKVSLPTVYEREFVLTQFRKKEKNPSRFWDLAIELDYNKMYTGEGYLWKGFSGVFGQNIFLYSHPCDLQVIKEKGFDKYLKIYKKGMESSSFKNRVGFTLNHWENLLSDLNDMEVSGLKSNVSEWMLESYKENWKVFNNKYNEYKELINPDLIFEYYIPERKNKIYDASFQLQKENQQVTKLKSNYKYKYPLQKLIEETLTEGVDDSYYLIQGSNWFDETIIRDSELSQLKTFASRNTSFPTVGFRYVVKLKAID